LHGSRKELFDIVNSPGPGSYEPPSPRTRALAFKKEINPKATKHCFSRIPYIGNPGPTHYNHSIDFGSQQRNFSDTMPVYNGNKFGNSQRNVFEVHRTRFTPGPGEYIAPS
jgi:hypothetical protein